MPRSIPKINDTDGGDENDTMTSSTHPLIENQENLNDGASPQVIRRNFLGMTILFAINHGCTVSVLGLANARLGSIGVWQSGILYASYTIAALYGASYFVKRLGSRNGLVMGLGMSASYVTSFFLATIIVEENEHISWLQSFVAIAGAIIGGIGSSILWVSQGTYFSCASQLFASKQDGAMVEDVTSGFGGNFAFIFLLFEVLLRLMSTFLIETAGLSWKVIFGLYTLFSILPVLFMLGILDVERVQHEYNLLSTNDDGSDDEVLYEEEDDSPSHKATAALNLLRNDPKAKFLAPMSVLFGISTSFCSSVLNGEVLQRVLNDKNSTYVGMYTSVTSAVAAGASLLFGRLQSSKHQWGKEPFLTLGASSYLAIALQFLALPDGSSWNRWTLLLVYIFLGLGRSIYEGMCPLSWYSSFFVFISCHSHPA